MRWTVDSGTGCWEWSGFVGVDGYGRFAGVLAHRIVYEETHDRDIPDGMVLHHKCRNRRCVNPDHLRLMRDHEHRVLHNPGDLRPVTCSVCGDEYVPPLNNRSRAHRPGRANVCPLPECKREHGRRSAFKRWRKSA